jgi:hypothetical protein
MKIVNLRRVEYSRDPANLLARFDVELDDGTRFTGLSLVQADSGRWQLMKGHGLSPVIAARILDAAVAEYDSGA